RPSRPPERAPFWPGHSERTCRTHLSASVRWRQLRLRFALRIDGELMPITFVLCVVICASETLFLPEAWRPVLQYVLSTMGVANLFPPEPAWPACQLWKISAANRRALPTDKPTMRSPSHPF